MTHHEFETTRTRALTAVAATAALFTTFVTFAGADFALAQGRNPGRGGDSSPQRGNPSPSAPTPSRSEPQRSEPRRESPRVEQPRRDSPRVEAPRNDSPRIDSPRPSSPRVETPRREEPRIQYQRASDPTPSRETAPIPRYEPGRSPFGDDRRSGREASPIPRNEPSGRRDDPRSPSRDSRESYQIPRRDNPTPPGRDPSSPARDGNPRVGDTHDRGPQRDGTGADNRPSGPSPGTIVDRRNPTERHDRIGDPQSSGQGPRRDSGDRRSGGPGPIRSDEPGGRRGSTRTENFGPERDRARDIFTRSQEGRYYNNGVLLRRGYYTPYREIGHYYPNYVYYPYYYPRYDATIVYFSPYSYYYGVCAPYIYRRHAYYTYPTSVWIDIPIYAGNEYRGWDDDRRGGDDYYLNRTGYYDPDSVSDRSLRDAVDDIRDAFHYGSIEHLVNLVDPQIKVAVFRKGKYEYSMGSNDYLDLTRDAMRNMETIQFDITRLRKRAASVYVASGKHVYRDREGEKRTVFVSFVLENLRDRWTITQIGTSPDKIQEP